MINDAQSCSEKKGWRFMLIGLTVGNALVAKQNAVCWVPLWGYFGFTRCVVKYNNRSTVTYLAVHHLLPYFHFFFFLLANAVVCLYISWYVLVTARQFSFGKLNITLGTCINLMHGKLLWWYPHIDSRLLVPAKSPEKLESDSFFLYKKSKS